MGMQKKTRYNIDTVAYKLNDLDGSQDDDRLSNHPDFVGIILILLENPESQPICDQDRKNPDFNSCCDIFVKFS